MEIKSTCSEDKVTKVKDEIKGDELYITSHKVYNFTECISKN